MADKARALYLSVRFGFLAIALAALGFYGPLIFKRLSSNDVAVLILILVIFTLLLRVNVPLSGSIARRKRPEPGRVALELPVMLGVVTIYGPIVAAALSIAGYALAVPAEGRWHLLRRLLDGGAQAVLWLALGTLYMSLFGSRTHFSVGSYLAFLALYVAGIYVFMYVVWLPLRALAKRIHIQRLWRSVSRDGRLIVFLALLTSWGYVCTIVWLRAGAALALACFGPLVFLSIMLARLNDQSTELQRLRLARDAVQAMIGKGDPIPQMNALLGSLHTRPTRETLQIHAALAPGDSRFSALATLGPTPNAEQFELCRRALSELRQSHRSSVTVHSKKDVVVAHAARSDEEIIGALVAYRELGSAAGTPSSRLTQAAAELGPLLRDFRSIAATKTAAALDVLTGLPNRRTIMELFRRCVARAAHGSPCAVLLLDIDRFKAINDQMGHPAGDHVLRVVGRIIARSVRANDQAGRIGGEEFLIVMPDTTTEMALSAAERLRAHIAAGELHHASGETVTASIGVAVAAGGETADEIFADADRALYRAKHQGRNRVVRA